MAASYRALSLRAIALNADTSASLARKIAIFSFGVAVAVGLVGAFLGLEAKSLWIDDLITAWIVEPDRAHDMAARLLTDLHPPVYFALIGLYSKIVGASDGALRSLSALFACAAVLVMVLGTARSFSLPARLFAGALATGSYYWVYQSHNVRSNALGMLFSAGLVVLSLAYLRETDPRARRRIVLTMIPVMLVGSFVHFYVLYVCLATLVMLSLHRLRQWPQFFAIACGLVVAAGLYVKLVMFPRSQVNPNDFWIPHNPGWYLLTVRIAITSSLGTIGAAAVALCAAIYAAGRLQAWRLGARSPAPPFPLLLPIGVPVVVFAGGIVSSAILSPNVTERNLLIGAPFIWTACAGLYDLACRDGWRPARGALDLALAAAMLWASTIVLARFDANRLGRPISEPFRSSAEWVRTNAGCRGQEIPVIVTDHRSWYFGNYLETITTSAYNRYLAGFATPKMVLMEDLAAGKVPQDVVRLVRQRIDGDACPILAWSVHNMDAETLAIAEKALLVAADRTAAEPKVQAQPFRDGATGYILHVAK